MVKSKAFKLMIREVLLSSPLRMPSMLPWLVWALIDDGCPEIRLSYWWISLIQMAISNTARIFKTVVKANSLIMMHKYRIIKIIKMIRRINKVAVDIHRRIQFNHFKNRQMWRRCRCNHKLLVQASSFRWTRVIFKVWMSFWVFKGSNPCKTRQKLPKLLAICKVSINIFKVKSKIWIGIYKSRTLASLKTNSSNHRLIMFPDSDHQVLKIQN